MKNRTDYTKPSTEKPVEKAAEKLERKSRKKPPERKAVVKADRLYLRSSAKKADNVVTILHKGKELVIDEETDKWLKVHSNNGETHGYVMKEFVDELLK